MWWTLLLVLLPFQSRSNNKRKRSAYQKYLTTGVETSMAIIFKQYSTLKYLLVGLLCVWVSVDLRRTCANYKQTTFYMSDRRSLRSKKRRSNKQNFYIFHISFKNWKRWNSPLFNFMQFHIYTLEGVVVHFYCKGFAPQSILMSFKLDKEEIQHFTTK